MDKISYFLRGSVNCHDAAIILASDEVLATAVAEAIVEAISIDIDVEIGGIRIHLAALLDPDHWEDDWREAGVEDVEEWLAGLVESDG